jgi:hypothetical protein
MASDRCFERVILKKGAAIETNELFMHFLLASRKAHSEPGHGQNGLGAISMPEVQIEEPAKQRWFRCECTKGTFSRESPAS